MNYCSSADTCNSHPNFSSRNSFCSPGNGLAGWDFIILTASNEVQALHYRKQIQLRLLKGFLPKKPRYIVVSDTEGKRIGSGGALFNVLKQIRESSGEEDCFEDKHILVINSGGDSQRIPQYSASGKVFAPVARELSKGISATLFDEIIKSFSVLPSQIPVGMLITTGDILLVFETLQVVLEDCDAAALSVSEDVRTGRNHGVFIPDEEGNVRKFLHKVSVEKLRSSGAEDYYGNVHLDTGVIWLSSRVVKDLFMLISTDGKIDYDKFAKFANEKSRLSFYADFVYPMARDSSIDRFYLEKPEGSYTDELKNCRTVLWQVLHKYPMKVVKLPADFIHFGTTAELLEMMTTKIKKYSSLGWKSVVNTNVKMSEKFSANGSFVDEESVIGDGSYIENSSISNSKVGNNCIVSTITLDSVEIPDNTVVHCLKQKDGDYVVRIYGIGDDPKLGVDDGGSFLGMPMRSYMLKNGLTATELWNGAPQNLWNAKLYSKSASLRQSLEHALSLREGSVATDESTQKVSLKESYEKAKIDYMLF